jgi:pimeloyl-ACP methyl ester carboxylesterase
VNASASLFEPHDFDYQGHTLAYETVGEGLPFVLLHGILLDAHINRALATRIAADGYRVILLDLLGHGRSDKTSDPKDHRADFYADQVIALLDHLGIERAVIGGVSLGCIVSLHVAVKAPQRVAGLFLEMPVMEWSAPWAALLLSPLLLAGRFLPFVYGPLTRLMRRLPRPHELRREWLASIMNTLSLDPRVVAAILHGTLVGPVVPPEHQRRALGVPALVLGHSGDKLHEFRDAHVLANELPQARLLEARHILELRTRPERLWPEISSFLLEVQQAEEARPAPRPKKRSRR